MAAVSLLAGGSPYTENFNTLATTGTSSTLPVGWAFAESGTNANITYTAGTGSSNAGDTYSFGAGGNSERALGGLQSGSLVPTLGASFINDSGATLTTLIVSYVGEQWRIGTLSRQDRIDFQYSLNATSLTTGTWTDVDALDFTAPTTTGSVGLLDGNAAANRTGISATIPSLAVNPGATLWIRWTSFDASGADDGLAVDDFSLSYSTLVNNTPIVSITAIDASASETGPDAGTFRFNRTGATTADLAVSYTVANVVGSAINGVDYTPTLGGSVVIPAGQSFVDVVISPVDDNAVEGSETVGLTLVDLAAYDVGTASATITIADNDALAIKIHDIQGAAHRSPLLNQTVQNVPGIVTAVGTNGFYLQDPNPDTDPATSEGIFVFTNSAPGVAVGDLVQVSGKVAEFRSSASNLSTTEIDGPTVVKLGTAALPAAVVIGIDRVPPTEVIENDATNVDSNGSFDPGQDGIDFWESLEGMRVQINNPVAISPTIYSGSSENIWVLANDGAGATSRTSRGGSLITASDFNPERIQLGDLVNTDTTLPSVSVGAKLGSVTGVVSYGGSDFEVLLGTAPVVVQASTLGKEVTPLVGSANQLTVATFNAENLDPSDGAAKFNGLAAVIVNNLRSPDIINVEEVQDNNGAVNDGTVAANVTIQTLISAIAAAGGPTYQYRQIDPVNGTNGGEPGGNIRVVFLYNPARVDFVDRPGGTATTPTTVSSAGGQPQLSASPGLVDPTNGAFSNSRKPIAGEFKFNGETVFVIGNHFVSKGGDDPLFGVTQPPVLSSESGRNSQATIVKDFVQSIEAVNPNAKIVVAGDLNDFEFSNPLNILKSAGPGGPGLTALIETLQANERYSYNFDGNAQTLDHLMASVGLTALPTAYDVVHVNSEFVDQISDHDPALARFTIAQPTFNGTSGRDILSGGAGQSNDILTGGQGRDILAGGAGADTFAYTGLIDFYDLILDFQVGQDKLDVSALRSDFPQGTFSATTFFAPITHLPQLTVIAFDPDGPNGIEAARPMLQLIGVQATVDELGLGPIGT